MKPAALSCFWLFGAIPSMAVRNKGMMIDSAVPEEDERL
jgi:hypothetical protein